jgi:hypothetical protein
LWWPGLVRSCRLALALFTDDRATEGTTQAAQDRKEATPAGGAPAGAGGLQGASATRSKRLSNIAPPGGVGDEVFFHPYCLEVCQANVLALQAAGID